MVALPSSIDFAQVLSFVRSAWWLKTGLEELVGRVGTAKTFRRCRHFGIVQEQVADGDVSVDFIARCL
jgi:hypothetical protein